MSDKLPRGNIVPDAPAFSGIGRPSTDMQATRDGRRAVPFELLLDLSVARSIAAGTQVIIGIGGNSFYSDPLIDLTTGLQIGGTVVAHFEDVSLVAGGGARFTVSPQFIARIPFTRIMFENVAQPGKFARIVYGTDVDFTPGINAQVSIAGTVSVSNAARYGTQATDAGNAFLGYVDIAGANFVHVQLKNPGASGKTVYLDKIVSDADALRIQELWRFDTDLTTLVGNPLNRLLGGAAGVAQLRSQNNAVALGTTRIARRSDINAGGQFLWDFRDNPIALAAGQGVILLDITANGTVMANFETREY